MTWHVDHWLPVSMIRAARVACRKLPDAIVCILVPDDWSLDEKDSRICLGEPCLEAFLSSGSKKKTEKILSKLFICDCFLIYRTVMAGFVLATKSAKNLTRSKKIVPQQCSALINAVAEVHNSLPTWLETVYSRIPLITPRNAPLRFYINYKIP